MTIKPLYGEPVALPDDLRKVEFVRSLLEKTKEGKVSWTKKGNAFTTTVPNGVAVNFIMGTGPSRGSWELFTVRDRTGNEILQVTGLDFESMTVNLTRDSLQEATNQLFAVVASISNDELERAIDSLKKL